ncbi:TIGR04283 family arsenosugar biosynthesis glycosyltransferase [uncultured Desulfosarcina sp.]|uniref:TIGR04283 family arsenosugar biosynthesis glycosyltransferase n=1 Tax=uncultured Desulfosarcina sp. TaxID=218289 RepID=UPI0029C95E42|nr:TIGR04283 family arsenosugar biosynthesis glycosyltransferase [uncultured Desulfosarcina sp.]
MMTTIQEIKKDRLIIFGRYPVPGNTKTRLIPGLGPLGAADLQCRLTEKILGTARRVAISRQIDIEFCFTGGSVDRMKRWLGSNLLFTRQPSGNLGESMHTTFVRAFNEGCNRVVLIGTDISLLTEAHLENAFNELVNSDLVLGPSSDGGYWLVGLNDPNDIFSNVAWGTETVLRETLDNAAKLCLSAALLDILTDIDTIADIKEWRPEEAEKRPYISVIIPTLNEDKNIASAIKSATCENTEIIVVDGGSTDNTVQCARKQGAKVVSSPKGRAIQQNRGAQMAKGKVLLFLHADTILPGHYEMHVFDAMMDPGLVAGAFTFKTDMPGWRMGGITIVTNFRAKFFKMPYGDQCLFIRKSVFESIGGFPDVQIAEDLFLIRALKKMGRISILPIEAITSSRRWKQIGILRTWIINQIIVIGCFIGVSPRRLSGLYRIRRR